MINRIIRFSANFALSAVLVLFFVSQNWLSLQNIPILVKSDDLNKFLVAGIIALVIFIVGEVLGFIFRIVRKVFFIFGCLLTVVYFLISGYLKLFIATIILPGWFVYNPQLAIVLIMTLLIGFVRVPQREEVDREWEEFQDWKKDNQQNK